MIESQIEQDLKTAMLARDTQKTSTLRGLKSAFLYEKVAAGTRGDELTDEDATKILQREAKKRQESADLYKQGGNNSRADQELAEKAIIEEYLPSKLSEDELTKIVEQAIEASDQPANMGQIIGAVKLKTAGAADGSDIARIVKSRLS